MDRTHSLPCFLRPPDRCGLSSKAAACPFRDLLERVPFETLQRQHLARRIAELERTERYKEDKEIKNAAGEYHEPAWSKADLRSVHEQFPETFKVRWRC